MSIDLEKAYFKKLEKYVGKKINIVSNENEIRIIYDVETSYVLQEEKEIFYFYCNKKSKNRIIRINTGILSNMKQKIKEFYH